MHLTKCSIWCTHARLRKGKFLGCTVSLDRFSSVECITNDLKFGFPLVTKMSSLANGVERETKCWLVMWCTMLVHLAGRVATPSHAEGFFFRKFVSKCLSNVFLRIGLPSIPFGRHLVLDHREIVRVGPWNEKGSAAVMFYFSVESACSMRRSQNSVFFGSSRLFSARVLLIALF